MKRTTSLILIIIGFTAALATQSNEARYSYRVSGKVIFKKNQSPPGATVYFMAGTRPIEGRIPWVHAAKDGTFSFELFGVSDHFHVCAHPGETGGLLPLAPTDAEVKKMPIKLSCTRDFRLDAHRDQRVELRLK